MLKRLRIKFICINMAIVTVMLAGIFGTVIRFTQYNLEQQSVQMMREILTDPLRPANPEIPGQEMQLPYFILIREENGQVTAVNNSYYDLSDKAFLEELITIVSRSEEITATISRYDLRFYRTGIPQGEMIVFSDMSTENSIISGLLHNCVLIAAGSLLIFFFLSVFLGRWAIRPIEQSWERQRQFVADASHELKTPLTVITTNAELLQSPGCDAATLEKCSNSILTMSRQMRGLVEGLLELARIDNGTMRTTFMPVDFSALIQDALLPFDAVFFEGGLTLQCDIDPGIRIMGSESHLRQVADILLDNAGKYSSPGGTVTLSLTAASRGQCLLRISNPGPEVSKEDQSRIFERFYRADKVRTMSHSYGLGLSIARSIILDHQGKIWCESAGGMNTFSVQLPMA